jgi:hypothetical protein
MARSARWLFIWHMCRSLSGVSDGLDATTRGAMQQHHPKKPGSPLKQIISHSRLKAQRESLQIKDGLQP